jgi:acetyl esterase
LTLLSASRKSPQVLAQVLFYPVTDASLDTPSYQQFADGPWLTRKAMEWFWNAYEPRMGQRERYEMSPLRAPAELLSLAPPALVITAESDVLRDEGEAYAARLMQAGVGVTAMRYLGTLHDFVMLNALAGSHSAQHAVAAAASFLRARLAH